MTDEPTELCELAFKYGSDKCPRLKHSYTPVYYEMFKDRRNSIKKVLEVGIGYYKTINGIPLTFDQNLNRKNYHGAGLKMWRDFFTNAQIYGADIVPDALMTDERIATFLCDETKKEDIENLIRQTGSDIDIFVDDGSHRWRDQVFLAKTILPLLKKDVIYVIEDVKLFEEITKALSDYEINIPNFVKKLPDDRLLFVRNK